MQRPKIASAGKKIACSPPKRQVPKYTCQSLFQIPQCIKVVKGPPRNNLLQYPLLHCLTHTAALPTLLPLLVHRTSNQFLSNRSSAKLAAHSCSASAHGNSTHHNYSSPNALAPLLRSLKSGCGLCTTWDISLPWTVRDIDQLYPFTPKPKTTYM